MEKIIGKIDRETKKHLDNISDIIENKINNCFVQNDSIKLIPKLNDEFNELKEEFKQLAENFKEIESIVDIKSSIENISSSVNEIDIYIKAKIKELEEKLDAIKNYLIDDDNNKYLCQTKDIIEQIGNNWINE